MTDELVDGVLLDESIQITLGELCRACDTHAEWVIALVSEGVLVPFGEDPREWRFPGSSMQVVRTAKHLEVDLGVNLAGIALALDLLAEVERLTARVERLSSLDPQLLAESFKHRE